MSSSSRKRTAPPGNDDPAETAVRFVAQWVRLTAAITDPPPIAHLYLDLSVLDRAVLRTARRAPRVLRTAVALAHARQHRQAR
ncbi:MULTISPECIES: hypothetical protein [Rhodococcus]|uniref:DUF3263 domain-containing protein n=1 Tax=Rhodococcus indonesiensis TaxID=3055869 RepID=A0ABT7RP00_9NOCA|nr:MULTISPECIES: hypothetical protein [Rhodococcus]MDM7489364.1 hypothetical protein [Rhodococcus indonesiensis]